MRHMHIISLILLSFVFGLMGCEEESSSSTVRKRGVKRAVKRNSGSFGYTNYQKAGNGPQKAPDWISSQDLNVIRRFTNKPINGFRNGNSFEPKEILIERREMGWRLVINELSLAYDTQPIFKGQRIEIPFNQEPSNEFKQQALFETSKATWRIPNSKIIGKTTAWIADSSYTIEILEWQTKPYKAKGDVFQVAGTATGRVVIHFVDQQGIQGWVAGRFEEVPVRYMGDPTRWTTSKN